MENTTTKFKRLLKEKDLHGSQIARRVGVSDVVVWKWLNGKSTPKAENIRKLAEALGVSVDEVIACFEE